jgi:hypothetical protein
VQLQIDHGSAGLPHDSSRRGRGEVGRGCLTPEPTRHQARSYVIIPGLPAAYTLSRYEMMRLRERHTPCLSRKAFHDAILRSGELSYHWLDRASIEARRP